MKSEFVFTSESVTEGHPDKLCDQVSDAIVGHYLRRDAYARVAAECAVSTGIVFLSVKTQASATVDVADVARGVLRRVGYEGDGLDARSCTVMTSLNEVPRRRVDEGDADLDRITSEEQATVFGYACRHTRALLPLPIWLAHKLARRLSGVRRSRTLGYLCPDGMTQVGVVFRERRPRALHSVTVIATQGEAGLPSPRRLYADVLEHVVRPAFEDEEIRPDDRTHIAVNPVGPIEKGGPLLHAGLTGRKTGVDTYGEYARQGGAALSGKDPDRIDRAGAYAARHAAKNVVAAGLADECEVQLSYSIGVAAPVSVGVETHGTAAVPEDEIVERLRSAFDFRVAAVVRRLRLRELPLEDGSGFFQRLAAYGHVGRADLRLPWEELDAVDALRG